MDFEMVQELRSGTKVFKWLYLQKLVDTKGLLVIKYKKK